MEYTLQCKIDLTDKDTETVYYVNPLSLGTNIEYPIIQQVVGDIVVYTNDSITPEYSSLNVNIGVAHKSSIQNIFVQKDPVRVSTVEALPSNFISGLSLVSSDLENINSIGIDGVSDLSIGDRILVKDESDPVKNGLYEITSTGNGLGVSLDKKSKNAIRTIYSNITTESQLRSLLSSCSPGDTIQIASSTTITLVSDLVITKPITLRGVDTSSVLTSNMLTLPNNGLINISSGIDNVSITDLTIEYTNNSGDIGGTFATIRADTCTTVVPNGATGLLFKNLNIKTTEFGIAIAANSFEISDCKFEYTPLSGAGDTHRYIGIYNIGTYAKIYNTQFKCTLDAAPNYQTIFVFLGVKTYDLISIPNKSTGFTGELEISHCTQISGNLRAFVSMESFRANGPDTAPMALHNFSLNIHDNSYQNYRVGSISLYSNVPTDPPLDFFDTISLLNNTSGYGISTRKGLLSLDGSGTLRSTGIPNLLIADGNTIGDYISPPSGLSGTYFNGSTVSCLIGVNTTVYNLPSPLITPILPRASWIFTRTSDADSWVNTTPGMYAFVQEGEENANTYWQLISDTPISVNLDPQYWDQTTGAINSWCSFGLDELNDGHICYWKKGSVNETFFGEERYLAVWLSDGTNVPKRLTSGSVNIHIKLYRKSS